MEVEIKGIKVDSDSLEAIIHFKQELNSYEKISIRDINHVAQEKIVNEVVKQYLAKNLHEIMSKIDQQQILNMIVLNSARKVSQ